MLNPVVRVAVVYSGLFAVGSAYIIWIFGIRDVRASYTAIYANLVPTIALAIGIVRLGETMIVIEAAGALMILTRIILVRRP